MKDSKIRVRSNDELKSREKCFLEITNMLKENNINFFLQGGVLLGAYREKSFIKWDWDVEISLFRDDFYNNFHLIKKKLQELNFKIYKDVNLKKNIKIDCYKEFSYETSAYTLMSWNYDKSKRMYFRKEINIPEKFLKKFSEIIFLNNKFYCPNPIEEYLTYQYGDWQTPLRTSIKKDYMTSKYFNEESFTKKIIKQIYYFVRSQWQKI